MFPEDSVVDGASGVGAVPDSDGGAGSGAVPDSDGGAGSGAVPDSDGGAGSGAGVTRGTAAVGGRASGGRDVRVRVRAAPRTSLGVGVAASAASATGTVTTVGAGTSSGSKKDGSASGNSEPSDSDAKQYYYFKHKNDLCAYIEGTEDRLQVIIMEYKPSINVTAADEQRDKYVCLVDNLNADARSNGCSCALVLVMTSCRDGLQEQACFGRICKYASFRVFDRGSRREFRSKTAHGKQCVRDDGIPARSRPTQVHVFLLQHQRFVAAEVDRDSA